MASKEDIALVRPWMQLWRMIAFSLIVLFIALILYQQLYLLFITNPALHLTIILFYLAGSIILYSLVIRLFRETSWLRRAIEGKSKPSLSPPEIFLPLSHLAQSGISSTSAAITAMDSVLTITFDRIERRLQGPVFITRLMAGLGTIGLLWSIAGGLRELFNGFIGIQTAIKANSNTTDVASALAERLAFQLSQGVASVLFAAFGVFVLTVLSWCVRRANDQLYQSIEDMLSFVTMVPKESSTK